MLDRARDISRRLPHAAAHRQIAMTLLAAHCAEDSIDEFGLEHHWLSEALALSISNGSACGMLEAMNGLMGYYVSTGRDDEVYALAKESLSHRPRRRGNSGSGRCRNRDRNHDA